MSDKLYLRVVTKSNTFRIPAASEIDEEGSLVRFFIDGTLELAVRNDEFIFCELVGSND